MTEKANVPMPKVGGRLSRSHDPPGTLTPVSRFSAGSRARAQPEAGPVPEGGRFVSLDVFGHIAWLPVILGAVLYYLLGAVWYSPPVFLNVWRRALGLPLPAPAPGPMEIAVPAIAVLVMSIATGALAVTTGTTTISAGITLGLTVGVGYALAMVFLAWLGTTWPAPWTVIAVSGGYHLIGLAIVGAIVGAWR